MSSPVIRSETPDRKRKHKSRHKEKGTKVKRSKLEKKIGVKRKHRKKGGTHDTDAEHELLMHAAVGSTKQLRQLLDGHPHLDLAAFDATGATALHHACREGHLEAVELLLRRGADIDAQDTAGDSAAHLAATHGHLKLLTVLLQAHPAPHIERRNARGVSVRQLAESVMGHRDLRSWGEGDEEELSPEEAWRQRLAEEAPAGGDFGGGYGDTYDAAGASAAAEDWSEWGSWEWAGASGDGGRAGRPQAGSPRRGGGAETEDDFAQRIWLEMERRRHAQQQSASSVLSDERRQAEERRKAAESEAYQRSRKILEEEIGKDRAWRRAVQQGDAGSRRAQYEARWHSFVTAPVERALRFEAMPWIMEGSAEEVKATILYGTSGAAEERKRLRLELMRWHPDKFTAKFGRRLAAGDRDRIMERVTQISQQLNALAA